MTFVADIEPKDLWDHFDRILTIPRRSKHEDEITAHVIAIAEKAGLEHEIDAAGNVVVRKPAAEGHENAVTTILQSHLDMVTEKNSDVTHDFTKDPITPVRDGDYLTADGTTLGADNGIGVAAMLAVLEDKQLVHGPLEFAFTIDEETGLTGAAQLNGEMLKGRQLLNLDSEEEGSVYVGCAGGGESFLSYPVQREVSAAGWTGLDVSMVGLKGGHSGGEIHLQRGNAVKLLARCLLVARSECGFRLVSFSGGNAHNAIPRESFARLAVNSGDAEKLTVAIQGEFASVKAEYSVADPDMQIVVTACDAPDAWTEDTTGGLLRLVSAVPHGVESMSLDIPGLVETSTNLATLKEDSDAVVLGLSSRSSVASALEAQRLHIRSIGELAGASVEEDEAYPGWKPNLDSRVLAVVRKVHKEVLGVEPEVTAIHAGLECGIIGEKIPGIDMVSIGPQIEFPHSPDERVKVDSVGEFYNLLKATLEALA